VALSRVCLLARRITTHNPHVHSHEHLHEHLYVAGCKCYDGAERGPVWLLYIEVR